jgi:farnesol dehydrogenase
MKKYLVTGATGFVGGELVPRLLARGSSVRVFVRDGSRLDNGVRDKVEIVEGDLQDEAAMDRAVAGCDTVLHLAALAQAFVSDNRDYFRVNTDAVDSLLRASHRHGVGRVVHVSSVAALSPARYSAARGIPRSPTVYGESKRAAELLVARYVADGNDAVIVRPSRVYGPGPWTDANGTTRLMALYLEGKLRFRMEDGDVEANYVHVQDVAEGIILAAQRGRKGQAYALGGENASLAGYLGTISRLSGIRRRVLKVPPQAVLAFARLCELYGRCGGSPSLTSAWINNFLEHRPMDLSSSRADLGYAPRTLESGVAQTLQWLLGIGGGETNVYRSFHRVQQTGI